MEESPLMLSAYRRNTKLRKFFVLVSILFAVSLVSTIILAVLYTHEKTKNNNPPAAPTPYDNSDDFPLYPPQPWNVSANHTNPLDFPTSQGTWMSIDVSKDGSTILFDMLGDIYTLPIAGGAATPLRTGVPFETQPRYSPDGNYILFTSDISGCDNLWIMNLQSKEQYQVTNETYHFVSNGYWIDDNTVVAVKWYTSTRSISAGEIWIYNVNTTSNMLNNAGTRLVGRTAVGAQVGPEEPVPLTKNNQTSIFYSQNVMDGYTWNYNKDPHQVIYAIFQVDVASGASTTISYGAGGAARPVISHSGNLLAFIKRTVYNTSLVIHNLATGNEYVLFGNLDFDQQECSAPAGVYPGYAFTPDDKAIIVWAQGNIYSIDTTTGVASQIAFTVNVHLDLSPTVRYNHTAADGATFSTKIITSPSISGDKKSFAFTSLATTYIYNNESGQATSLDATPLPDGVFQFWPSISKDNAHLVQVIWNDHNLSTIEVVRLSDKTKYTLPTPVGRYAYPQFSPNGKQIVFTRLDGDSLSGSTYTMNSGIYTASFSAVNDTVTFGTPAALSTSTAWSPVFTSDGNSILAQSGDYPVSVSEISTGQGSQFGSASTLASSLYATEIAVSPNKEFVAFIEFRKVYVAPYAQGSQGKAMNVTSLSSEATPHAQLCPSAGGQFLTWSYDSSTLYWVWGPTLYELVVPALKSCSGDCVSNKIKTYNLSVQVATEVVPSTQVVAFTNAVILTMENEEVISEATIVVTGDVITALGWTNETTIPAGATTYDLQGGFVMPGFIDAHAHWNGAWAAPFKVYADWEMFVNLAFGVTTMHNPSADSLSVFQDAELIRAGRKVGPRIFSTGQIIYGAGGSAHCDIASSSDAEYYLLNLQAVGAWSAKSYNQPCRAARQRILDAARSLQMNVVPEGGMAYYWNLNQIIDGHTTIEHAIPMAPLYDDVITLFASSGTAWTPTFIVNYGGIWGERYWFQHTEPWANQRLMMYAPEDFVQPTTMRFVGAQDTDYHQFATSRAVAQVHQKGGIVEAGAHGEMQGIGIHWEMQMFSQSGLLSPYEVLQTATINPARALGLDSSVGSLKVGKLADLIFYDATNDPRTLNTENVVWVMKNGHLYNASTMDQILPSPKARATLPQLNLYGPPGSSNLRKKRSHHPENH